MQKELFIVSLKMKDTMDQAWSLYASASLYESASRKDFLCSTYKPHFFWDSFATLQVASYDQRSGHPFGSPGVRIMLWESKTKKI